LLVKDGKLFVDAGPNQWQLHFTSPDEFFLYEDRSDLQFVHEDGRVSGILINHQRTFKRTAGK